MCSLIIECVHYRVCLCVQVPESLHQPRPMHTHTHTHTRPSGVNLPNQYRSGGGGGGGGGNGGQPRLRFEFVKPPAAVSYLEAYDRTAEQLQRRLSKELRGQQDVATKAAEELRGNGCLSKYRSTIAAAVSTFQDLPRPGTRCIASCMTRATSEPTRYPRLSKKASHNLRHKWNGLSCSRQALSHE